MTLRQLKYFLAVADELHFTRAAERLYISQPSLSYSLSELEKELGAPLFERRGGKTVLTGHGQAFLPHVRAALAGIEGGVRAVRELAGEPAAIRLGYIYSLSFSYLPGVVSGFLGRPENSGVTFSFFQGLGPDIAARLRRRELDIALTADPPGDGLASVPVLEQELFLVVPEGHRLSAAGEVEVSDLQSERLVAISPKSSLRGHIDSAFAALDQPPDIAFEAEECNSMASFVGAGFGVAIMPEIPALGAYNVRTVPFGGGGLKRTIRLVWPDGAAPAAAVKRFIDYLA